MDSYGRLDLSKCPDEDSLYNREYLVDILDDFKRQGIDLQQPYRIEVTTTKDLYLMYKMCEIEKLKIREKELKKKLMVTAVNGFLYLISDPKNRNALYDAITEKKQKDDDSQK